jgi:hypothetical protein
MLVLATTPPRGRTTMPYARVSVLSYDPARYDDLDRFANEQFIPKVRRLPGFRRYTAAGDRAGGKGLTISEWDTQEQAQGVIAAVGLGQELADLGLTSEAVYVYEVVTQI